MCFTETWLNKNHYDDSYFPSGFNVYRHDRKTIGGGVAIIVHEKFISTKLEYVNDPECECICVKIDLQPVSLVIYLAYVKEPTMNVLTKHLGLVQKVISQERNSRVIVLGDFNLHSIKWNSDENEAYFLPQDMSSHIGSVYYQTASEFLQKMHQLPMFQISNVKNVASNVLDLVFVNETDDIQLCTAPVSITKVAETDPYHPPLEISFEYEEGMHETPTDDTMEIFLYGKGNYARMCQQLDELNFAQIFDQMDVDEAFEYFYEELNSLIVQNIPKKTIRKFNNRPVWWTKELQTLKNKRDKLFKRKSKSESSLEYTQAVTKFNQLQNELYGEHINKIETNIVQNPAEFWSYAKEKQKRCKYPIVMQDGEKKGSNPSEIVELFADFFESVYVDDEPEINFDDVYGNELENAIEIDLTMVDIENAIKRLKSKSSSGPDNLSPLVIKNCMDSLVWPLWILHRKLMEKGKIATTLKTSRVVPEFKKKGVKTDIRGYRIIAISSVILRVYEIAMQEKLLKIVDPQISNPQHGFRPKRSITTNMMNLSIEAHQAFANKQQLDVFYGDFQNAFDKVNHRILLQKMRKFRIGKKTAKWLFEFLVGRTFFVQIGKYKSRVYEAKSGVPAGSVLGPTLFLIHIDDITESITYGMLLLFADDIKITMPIGSMGDTRYLQADIDGVRQWSETNKLPFNPEKCVVMSIRRTNEFHNAIYVLGNHVIERKEENCDLGLLVDRRMTFAEHREQITTKARQSMGYIKWISKGQFGPRTLKVLYSAYVRSKLDFGSVIWDPDCQVYRDDIESIQKQFVMYALGDTNRVPPYILPPYEERCEKLGLIKLETRRLEVNAIMAYDLYNGFIKDKNIENKLIKVNHNRSLRDNRLLREMTYTNDYSYNQPLAKIVRLINKYSNLMTLNRTKFKIEIRKNLREEN